MFVKDIRRGKIIKGGRTEEVEDKGKWKYNWYGTAANNNNLVCHIHLCILSQILTEMFCWKCIWNLVKQSFAFQSSQFKRSVPSTRKCQCDWKIKSLSLKSYTKVRNTRPKKLMLISESFTTTLKQNIRSFNRNIFFLTHKI